ncbi:MAG: hypothetical protein IKI31_04280, partial [Treponema sp.]|nr:hypothetical protein [Treponema sp.]
IGKVFGDAINPAGLFITRNHTEGVAVAAESEKGEGRLNNAYSLHSVRQAKIENRFPRYAETYGSRDMYPYNNYYIFGGAFVQYLQKKYGLEKYAKFWYKCVNFQTIHHKVAFKSVYGISAQNAWKNFIEEVKVPKTVRPLEENFARDYFSKKQKYSARNLAGARYTDLSVGKSGFGFRDESSGAYYFAKWDSKKNEYTSARKIFSLPRATRTHLSSCGKYLAVTFMNNAYATAKSEVCIYNVKNKTSFKVNEKSLTEGAVVFWNGKYYLVAVKIKSQDSTLYVYELEESKHGIKSCVLVDTVPFKTGTSLFSLDNANDGNIVFACCQKNSWSVKLFSLATKKLETYFLPVENAAIQSVRTVHNFEPNENASQTFLLSFAAKEMLPRLGQLFVSLQDLEGERLVSFKFMQNDVSGGVFFPTMLSDGAVAYVGNFFLENRLLLTNGLSENESDASTTYSNEDKTSDSKTDESILGESIIFDEKLTFLKNDEIENAHPNDTDESDDKKDNNDNNENNSTETENIFANAKKYNPLKFYKKGIFLPFSVAQTYNTFGEGQRILPWGITYGSTNPWTSKLFLLSAGYSMFSNSAALEFHFGHDLYPNGTDTDSFKYNVSNQVEFDRSGFKQTNHSFHFNSALPFGKVSHLVLENKANIFYGRTDKPFNVYALFKRPWFCVFENLYAENILSLENSFYLGYSNVHKFGDGRFEQIGIGLYAGYHVGYDLPVRKNVLLNAGDGKFSHGLGAMFQLKMPRLFPYACKNGFTYNFPFKIESSMLMSANEFWTNKATLVLFATEVQKAVPLFYINRFRMQATYSGTFLQPEFEYMNFLQMPELCKRFAHGQLMYTDYVVLNAMFTFTPNFGYFANPALQFSFNVGLRYDIRPYDYNSDTPPLKIEWSFTASY